MTRKEITELLEIVISTYPYTKVQDANAMVSAWELTLGDYSAESVYKATRLHMNTSKFFPTPADIKEKILKAEMIYTGTPIESLPVRSGKSEAEIEAYLDDLCAWVGLGENKNLGKSLPFEI